MEEKTGAVWAKGCTGESPQGMRGNQGRVCKMEKRKGCKRGVARDQGLKSLKGV